MLTKPTKVGKATPLVCVWTACKTACAGASSSLKASAIQSARPNQNMQHLVKVYKSMQKYLKVCQIIVWKVLHQIKAQVQVQMQS